MISLIIPTFKEREALDLCLRSAVEGMKDKQQILVVADGTLEYNRDILEKYSEHIDVLPLSSNCGLPRATNMGVYNSKNEYILVINDDNVLPRNWDERLLSQMEDNCVVTPNQIEPITSMFKQFKIKNLGRNPVKFNLENFWNYVDEISEVKADNSGSTLPFMMKKNDFIKIGGWDELFPRNGIVADWDFFLRCNLNGFIMKRIYNTHFYHFVSLTENETVEEKEGRRNQEVQGHDWVKYKWGTNIKHDPLTNLKSL